MTKTHLILFSVTYKYYINHVASLHLILTELVGDTPDTVQCNLSTNHAASLHLTLTELVGGTPDTVQCNLNTILITLPVCT